MLFVINLLEVQTSRTNLCSTHLMNLIQSFLSSDHHLHRYLDYRDQSLIICPLSQQSLHPVIPTFICVVDGNLHGLSDGVSAEETEDIRRQLIFSKFHYLASDRWVSYR